MRIKDLKFGVITLQATQLLFSESCKDYIAVNKSLSQKEKDTLTAYANTQINFLREEERKLTVKIEQLSTVNSCKKCSHMPEFVNLKGDGIPYIRLECKCGNNSRVLQRSGIYEGCNLPQKTKEEATEVWNKLNPKKI